MCPIHHRKTFSEELFEQYLVSQGFEGYEYEKLWDGIPTRPDYSLHVNDVTYIFDVKELDEQPIPTGLFFRDPYARIREKINSARNQFKYFKDKPCCLVLWSFDPLVDASDWVCMLGAMYGDFGLSIPLETEKCSAVDDTSRETFLHNGKMFRLESSQPQNTTISALITLRNLQVGRIRHELLRDFARDEEIDLEEMQPSVIVWENAFARIPFPRTLFTGPYDQHWGVHDNGVNRVFVGTKIKTIQDILASRASS